MNTNELKELILEECKRSGITLSEDELNAKVLALSQIDDEKLERISGGEEDVDGGHFILCDKINFCAWNYRCGFFSYTA